MTDSVLVHGAWGGSWGFRKLRPLLSELGHQVFTPSLTGIGEREHLTGPDVSLSTHIDDVSNAIYYEDLTSIVLLGFSYGGMVVSGALDRIGDRVDHLVFLDAFVPEDGQSVTDLIGSGDVSSAPATDSERPWLVPPIPRQLGSPAETAWAEQRRSGQPVATFTEAVRLATPIEDRDLTLTYVKAVSDPGEGPDSAFWRAARHAESSDRWRYDEIETNHMIPLMEPQQLVAILVDLADGAP